MLKVLVCQFLKVKKKTRKSLIMLHGLLFISKNFAMLLIIIHSKQE
jgi:hypothetical protein